MNGARILLDVAPRGSGREKFTYAGTIAELVKAQREVGDNNRDAILRVLQDAPEALSTDQVQPRSPAGIKLEKRTIQRHLKALVKAGFARQTGKGKATRYFALLSDRATPPGANEGGANE